MAVFKTLIIIPEGAILNQKLAVQKALQQTYRHWHQTFGKAQVVKYHQFLRSSKLLSQAQRLDLLNKKFLQYFDGSAVNYLQRQLQFQDQLLKNSINFLQGIQNQVSLVLLSKSKRKTVLARLHHLSLTLFKASFFTDSFSTKLPDPLVFHTIIHRLKIDPNTVLVIGTSLGDEIQGAVSAGFQSLWLAPKREKIPISPQPTLHLTKLSDLSFYLHFK